MSAVEVIKRLEYLNVFIIVVFILARLQNRLNTRELAESQRCHTNLNKQISLNLTKVLKK